MQAGLAAGEAVPPEFVDLVKPHVQSFDSFLGDGLIRVVELLEPIEVAFDCFFQLLESVLHYESVQTELQCRSCIQSPSRLTASGSRVLLLAALSGMTVLGEMSGFSPETVERQ